ncbi:PAS domain-containing sensor histidine kinase [Rhodovibrionaceae bacterium A322]
MTLRNGDNPEGKSEEDTSSDVKPRLSAVKPAKLTSGFSAAVPKPSPFAALCAPDSAGSDPWSGEEEPEQGQHNSNALITSLEYLLKDSGPAAAADVNGCLLFANEAYRRLLPMFFDGSGPIQVDGEPGTTLPLVQEVIAETEGCGPGWSPEAERTFTLLDQNKIYGRFSVLRNGKSEPQAVVLRCQTRSSHREIRRQLAQLHERFEDIARLVSDWVWETDRNGNISYISHRVQEVLGYPIQVLEGRPLPSVFSSSTARLEDLLTSATQRPFRGLELEAKHQNGDRRLFMISAVPVYTSDDGTFSGFRGTAQDVTSLKARESALLRSKELAEGANQAKSEFLATVSHELRTPLNAIIGFSELMNNEIYGSLGHENYLEYSQDIHQSAHHLLAIINDILDVSKIEAGKFVLDDQEVDLLTVAKTTLRLITERAKENQVHLLVDLPESLPLVRGDARALRQVLLNVLSNAVKFTPVDGEVRLDMAFQDNGDLALRVQDTGIGMAEGDIETALTPFGQIDSRLARRFEGTGLGLPLSKGLTELHGGRLEVSSVPDEGTTVVVILPAHRVCH